MSFGARNHFIKVVLNKFFQLEIKLKLFIAKINLAYFVTIFTIIFCISISALIAQQDSQSDKTDVAESELSSTGSVPFISNEPSNIGDIDSRDDIIAIGKSLGTELNQDGNSSFADKYAIQHLPRTLSDQSGRLGADILILSNRALVDHIRNLRLIISSYLQYRYGYDTQRAVEVSVSITNYNTAYRGNIAYFQKKYASVVSSRLDASRVGLSSNYADWPGATQIVMPLSIDQQNPVVTEPESPLESEAFASEDRQSISSEKLKDKDHSYLYRLYRFLGIPVAFIFMIMLVLLFRRSFRKPFPARKTKTNDVTSKIIKSIHSGTALHEVLATPQNKMPDATREILRYMDHRRADLSPYPSKWLEDPNCGLWELWPSPVEAESTEQWQLPCPLVARNPASDVIDGIVGIDFGTSSTVVVAQQASVHIKPLRIGTGDLTKEEQEKHFENPTIMEISDLKSFLEAYRQRDGRPFTRWENIAISHVAFNSLHESSSSDHFYAYLDSLKQWTGQPGRKLKVVDKQGYSYDLPPFSELGNGDFDPIEVYAYYLGLYINNQHQGIYLNYYLSFPVTYELENRERILASFRRGLQKSFPPALLNNQFEMENFHVYTGSSEPAAYAIMALQAYNFEPKEGRPFLYGIFDFGGGTTDFDFGIWRTGEGVEERRYDYIIEHFGAGGDALLGGENLLEQLAFEIFKRNADKLRNDGFVFAKGPESRDFSGSELLLDDSREAQLNLFQLAQHLRPLWERHSGYEEKYQQGISLMLWNQDGDPKPNYSLECDLEELEFMLTKRIRRGVENFFHSLREAFDNPKLEISRYDKIHIFLAGNASKSTILKEEFLRQTGQSSLQVDDAKNKPGNIDHLTNSDNTANDTIFDDKDIFGSAPSPETPHPVPSNETEDKPGSINGGLVYELYPALGTAESYQKMEDMGISYTCEAYENLTGKTGVAFGLVESRKGSHIKVIDPEPVFHYYLGENRRKKFINRIDRSIPYQRWCPFTDASETHFELYYTSQPSAGGDSTLPISDKAIQRKRLQIPRRDVKGQVYIRKIAPTRIEYAVAHSQKKLKRLPKSDIYSVDLAE